MRDTLHDSLQKLRWTKTRKHRTFVILLVLSLIVSADVFWVLRQPGLTLAGDAACGIQEHHHDETCRTQICICESTEEQHIHEETCFAWETSCGLEEHSHEIICYSDETADVETQLDWQEMFAAYPYTGDVRKDLVGIAQTQVGYSESEMNYEVGADGVRRGYTRYGAWYGAPYGDWSAMFVSFCLHYAGADPAEAPGNTGADSMALLWDNLDKYAPAGTYTPVPGDLVFFNDNTVGIVTEVQNATFYVIRGDVNEAVCGEVMSLNDPSIDGWGLTEGTASEADMPLMMMQDEGGNTDGAGGADGTDTPENEVTDLKDYLDKPGGEFGFVLKSDGNEVAKDENKNYIVQPNVDYDLELIIKSLNGIHPGTYQYQMPAGLLLKTGANGTCTLQGTDVNVGTWTITENGLLTLEFFDNIKTYTEVEISATMGIRFLLQDEPIDFDGKITVTVEPPPEKEDPTELLKWGEQGDPGKVGKPDNTKLYWQLVIKGHEDSQLPGSVITDRLMNGEQGVHQYTDSDFEKGIRIGVSQPNPETGEELAWHQWTVYAGDPGLTWNENGWSYELPAKCAHCGSVSLGNDGWTYFVDFSSTPKPELIGGALYYYNQATVDGQNATGEATFNHGDVHAELIKNSAFHGDADGGSFLWELQAVIPGMKDGEKAEYFWYILDYMEVMTGNSVVDEVFNTANQATVTATVNGTAVKVPRVTDAAPEDQFAWDNSWSPMNPDETVEYGQQLDLLCRCRCTAENCKKWNQESGSCYSQHWAKNGFCHCWTVTQDTIFTFSYETNDKTLIEQYGGVGNDLRNRAHLHKKDFSSDGHEIYTKVVDAEAREPIPGIFKKELIEEFNGYTAHYQITVNEAKLVLTDGTPLIINDEMTETLAYISGSLVITTEDADGNTGKLQQGTDYTVTYDGTGTVKDSSGNPVHVLKIEILRPQPVMYILDYDTTLIVPPGGAKDVKYSNSASITLWGETLSDSTDENEFTNVNFAGNSYQVDVLKTDSQTSEPLAGAVFGLFNAQGGQMTTGESDGNGRILFITDVTAGVILRGHKLYYLQELKAPEGYQKDDSEHWFCFCNSNEESCAECDEVIGEKDAYRIPFDQIGEIAVANELKSYNLPATGGSGIYPLVFVSVILIVTSLIYGLYRRCKRERRGIG